MLFFVLALFPSLRRLGLFISINIYNTDNLLIKGLVPTLITVFYTQVLLLLR